MLWETRKSVVFGRYEELPNTPVIYLLASRPRNLYVGVTNDLER